MSTNYNLAGNRESGIPLCSNNHPGNVSRCTAWKAASLEVALTHHDLEPYNETCHQQPGLAPWPGFQPHGSQGQFSDSVGSGVSYGYPVVYGKIVPVKDTDPRRAGWQSYRAVGQAVHCTETLNPGATVRNAVLYSFMRWSVRCKPRWRQRKAQENEGYDSLALETGAHHTHKEKEGHQAAQEAGGRCRGTLAMTCAGFL